MRKYRQNKSRTTYTGLYHSDAFLMLFTIDMVISDGFISNYKRLSVKNVSLKSNKTNLIWTN